MLKQYILAGLATLGCWSGGAPGAAAQCGLTAVDWSGSTKLWDLDSATGQSTNMRYTGTSYVAGIAVSANNRLFALTTSASIHPDSLLEIDPGTGSTTVVGATGLSGIYEGDLAWDPASGTLFGVGEYTGGLQWLFTVDTATGAASLVGSLPGVVDPSAMAFDAAGNLYVIDSSVPSLLRIDKTTGATLSSVALNSLPPSAVLGMAFDPADGVLYVGDFLPIANIATLNTCDPLTGAVTFLGYTTIPTPMAGLAFFYTATASATYRNDGGGTNTPHYSASPPVLGELWSAQIMNVLSGSAFAAVVAYASPLELYLGGPDDYLLVNIADPAGELFGLPTTASTTVAGFSLPIPLDANLCGFAVYTQGVSFGGSGGLLLHNAMDLVLGNF